MKKMLMLAFAMMIVFFIAACGNDNNEESNADDSETTDAAQEESEEPQNADEQKDTSEQEEDTPAEIEDESSQDSAEGNDDSDSSVERIIVTLDSGEIIINVYDNPTSREFLEQLPLTMTFEEFGGFEKLSYPPEELTTEESPDGYTPERGDFSYFSPWGNVTMFYDTHRYSNGLIKLGEIVSGVELLDSMHDDFTVSIERMN